MGLAGAFLGTGFFAVAGLAGAFLGTGFFAVAGLAGAFLGAGFFAVAGLAGAFLGAGFFAVAGLAGAFLGAGLTGNEDFLPADTGALFLLSVFALAGTIFFAADVLGERAFFRAAAADEPAFPAETFLAGVAAATEDFGAEEAVFFKTFFFAVTFEDFIIIQTSVIILFRY